MVDREQTFERSEVALVDFGSDKAPIGLKVLPNPYLEDFNVLVQTDNSETGTIVVYDIQGKQMYNSTEAFIKGENNVHINSLSSLPSGLYFVEVTTPKQKQIIRFMKGN